MLFNQRIGLIEATEELKRVNVDTKTFTQPIAHKYTDTAYYIEPQGVDLTGSDKDALDASEALTYFQRFTTQPDPTEPSPAPNFPYRSTSYKNLFALGSPLSIYGLAFWAIENNDIERKEVRFEMGWFVEIYPLCRPDAK